jgi:hypothetical protein
MLQRHQIVIRPGDQTSVLDFALLNFTDSEKNVYAYQFKGPGQGMDSRPNHRCGWVTCPMVRINCWLRDRQPTGNGRPIRSRFRSMYARPVYLQVWFLALLVVFVTVGIWGWFRWRIWNHEQEQKRLQTRLIRPRPVLRPTNKSLNNRPRPFINSTRPSHAFLPISPTNSARP